jgi:class 3 adenylate cyclase
VVTRVARDALEAAAPAGLQGAPIRFRRLGRYQLAGLHRPEALYQVEAGGLATDFAPLRAPAVADR